MDGPLASLAGVDLIYARTRLDPPGILDRPPVLFQKKFLDVFFTPTHSNLNVYLKEI